MLHCSSCFWSQFLGKQEVNNSLAKESSQCFNLTDEVMVWRCSQIVNHYLLLQRTQSRRGFPGRKELGQEKVSRNTPELQSSRRILALIRTNHGFKGFVCLLILHVPSNKMSSCERLLFLRMIAIRISFEMPNAIPALNIPSSCASIPMHLMATQARRVLRYCRLGGRKDRRSHASRAGD